MGYATTNPYTGEVVQEFPYATDAQVDAALEAGHAAFQAWRTTLFAERSRLLSNAARLMRQRREEFARLNTLEMGKLYTEALGEADVVAGIFDHYARHAEELLKPVHLDMMGRLSIGGQVCVGDKRLVIADALYEEFTAKLTAAVEALNPGDPMDPDTTFAPLSSQGAADTVKAQIAQAAAHGATATPIGKPVPATGAFVQPTILTGLTPDNPVFYQEIFGPVLSLFRAADQEAAIALANDSPYGLGCSIYSTNIERAVKVAERIEAGAITINKPTTASPELPFGGIKLSGYGREFGDSGIKEFTNAKVINTAGPGQLS